MDKLTRAQEDEYRGWTMPFAKLKHHVKLEYQMDKLGLQGLESASVIGGRGTGKTRATKYFLAKLELEELEKAMSDPSYLPRRSEYFVASKCTGPKTILLDMEYAYLGGTGRSSGRNATPKTLIDALADYFHSNGVRMLCIDEAQQINAVNMDLVRQVTDECAARNHPFSIMLIGSEELRDTLVEIRQQGQRFSAEITFNRLENSDVVGLLPTLHPFVGPLKASLETADWRALEAKLVRAVGGSFRRLEKLLMNINTLALAWEQPVSKKMVEASIAKLAAEG
jgi:hypothetical protein